MDETVRERLRGDLSDAEYARRIESVRVFERQLAAGGYLLVKLFLHISAQSQRERIEALESDKDTAWARRRKRLAPEQELRPHARRV